MPDLFARYGRIYRRNLTFRTALAAWLMFAFVPISLILTVLFRGQFTINEVFPELHAPNISNVLLASVAVIALSMHLALILRRYSNPNNIDSWEDLYMLTFVRRSGRMKAIIMTVVCLVFALALIQFVAICEPNLYPRGGLISFAIVFYLWVWIKAMRIDISRRIIARARKAMVGIVVLNTICAGASLYALQWTWFYYILIAWAGMILISGITAYISMED